MKHKFKKSNLFKLRYIIISVISILFGFYLYKIPYVNYKFLNLTNNIKFKNSGNSNSSTKNTEILFSPYIINNSMSSLDFSNFDLTLGIPSNQDVLDLSKFNFLPNVLVKNQSKIINQNKKSLLLDNDSFSKVTIENNSIVFMYLDKDLSNTNILDSYSKIIKQYKSKNYFIVLYIKPKTQITFQTINFLCNQGVNLIFSPSINNTYIEKYNSSIIIYGVENNYYIPQFDIVFNNHKAIALGIKFISWNILSDSVLADISKYTKNLPFKISNTFSFFDY